MTQSSSFTAKEITNIPDTKIDFSSTIIPLCVLCDQQAVDYICIRDLHECFREQIPENAKNLVSLPVCWEHLHLGKYKASRNRKKKEKL